MKNVLVISYSGFSDQDANGKTLKALLSGWNPENVMQFYCGNQAPDFSCCYRYFHVTDQQMAKSLFSKSRHYWEKPVQTETEKIQKSSSLPQKPNALSLFLKKHHYNFFLRTLREYLWAITPWGKKEFDEKVAAFAPDAVLYMVGESFSLDRIVLRAMRNRNIPLILYNAEAYRIIDLSTRKGLEKAFYRRSEMSYGRLDQKASLIFYNSLYLQEHYLQRYHGCTNNHVVYNADDGCSLPYTNAGPVKEIAYFGNLGVGRVESLIETARALQDVDESLHIDVYGRTNELDTTRLKNEKGICFRGFVGQDVLSEVKEKADILLHTESFDPEIMPKLRFAFSTKIAQCLCAGRCLVSYAPLDMASTQYLIQNNCALVITSHEDLRSSLKDVITNAEKRAEYARQALLTAEKNHNMKKTAHEVVEKIESILS